MKTDIREEIRRLFDENGGKFLRNRRNHINQRIMEHLRKHDSKYFYKALVKIRLKKTLGTLATNFKPIINGKVIKD